MSPDPLLTIAEVAECLRMSRCWVAQHSAGVHVRKPVLPCVRLGRAVRFRRQDVERFIEQWAREAA